MKIKCLLLIFLSHFTLQAQYTDWANFYNNKRISGIVREGNKLWVGCYTGGLVEYDLVTGSKVYFDKTNSGILQNRIIGIQKNFNGDKFMVSNFDEGLIKFNGGAWTNYNLSNSNIPSNKFKGQITIDNNNRAWLMIASNYLLDLGLARFDNATFTSYIGTNYIYNSSCSDHSGNVWFYGRSELSKFDGVNFMDFYPPQIIIPSYESNSITCDLAGNIWVGFTGSYNPNPPMNYRKGGLAKFDGFSWTEYDITTLGATSDGVSLVACDSSNNIWLTTLDNKLYRFDGINLVYSPINNDSTIVASSIYVDSLNNKWIGTYQQGVYLYDNVNWSNYDLSKNPLPNNEPEDIKIDLNNNVWCTFSRSFLGKGVVMFDRVSWHTYNYSNTGIHPLDAAEHIVVDKSNRKWFNSWGEGLIMFNDTTWTVYNTANSNIPSDTIGCLAIDSLNNLWFSTIDGIVKFNGTTFYKYDNSNTGLDWLHPNDCIAINNNNVVYVGRRGYLYVYDGLNWTAYNSQNSPLPGSAYITNIDFDSNNNAWFGTYFDAGGLYKLSGTVWTEYTTSNSALLSNQIDYTLVDSTDKVWIINDGDIVKFNPASGILDYNYKNSGIPDVSRFRNTLAFDYDGNLWLTTKLAGIAAYKPGGVILNTNNENISSHETNDGIKVYPSPCNDHLLIQENLKARDILVISDLFGRIIYIKKFETPTSNFTLPTAKFSNGIYFIKIADQVKKFVIQH